MLELRYMISFSIHSLSRGTQEHSPLWCVLNHMLESVCHSCGKDLTQPSSDPTSPPTKKCYDSTKTWVFCSEQCRHDMEPLFALEKPLFEHYSVVESAVEIDSTLLRLAVRFSLAKALEKAKQHIGYRGHAAVGAEEFVSSVSLVERMVQHAQSQDPAIRQTGSGAARMLWPVLPDMVKGKLYSETGVNGFIEDFLGVCARINANVHGLHLMDAHNTQFGVGLYPLCAMFNHSCLPNCVFVNDGPRLRIRAIRRIAQGEELLVNYICLGQAVVSRRAELLKEKAFVCNCRRCILAPNSLEEYNLMLAEQLLQGVRCKPLADGEVASVAVEALIARACTKLDKLPEPVKEVAESEAAEAAPSKGKAKGKGKSKDEDLFAPYVFSINDIVPGGIFIPKVPKDATERALAQLSVSGTDPDAWMTAQLASVYTSSADEAVEVTYEQVRRMEQPARDMVDQAIEVYSQDGVTMQQRKDAVDRAYKACVKYLAPGHELFFTLLPLLVNVYARIGDQKSRLDYATTMATLSEAFMPSAFLPLANTFEGVYSAANLLEKDLTSSKVSKNLLLWKMHGKKISDAKKSYTEKHLHVLRVCIGEEHPRYKDLSQKITRMGL